MIKKEESISTSSPSLILDLPDSDKKKYRHIKLSNKLEALLISDEKCDQAACALNVNVGSIFDPKEIQGLAHFLEHMLFLGTDKYPDETDYNKYLQQHSGHSNAYTCILNTMYYFAVGPDYLKGAIDRFSQFFISPLFTSSATNRELDAVHSEHTKNLLSDERRIMQLMKSTINNNHPLSMFATGNRDTLRDIPLLNNINVRQKLLDFHQKYYSANQMKLCVLGRERLDVLEDIVTEMFNDIKNNEIVIPKGDQIGYPHQPYRSSELNQFFKIIPVKDVRSIRFNWVLPEQTDFWRTKPTNYITHLLGHEGKGSLLSALKADGLATELCAGITMQAAGISILQCRIELTDLGLNSIEKIGKYVFDYLRLLKESPIQSWVLDELKNLANIQFKFLSQSSPDSYVVETASQMMIYPPKHFVSGPYLIFENNISEIEEMLDYLKPENLNVILMSKSLENSNQTWIKEEYYGTSYQQESIPKELFLTWTGIKQIDNFNSIPLKFPKPNPFVPKDLSLKSRENNMPDTPQKLNVKGNSKLFFKQDNEFDVPKACIILRFISPYIAQGLNESSLAGMFLSTIHEMLNEFAYDAQVAGLGYALSATIDSKAGGDARGFDLQVVGYNDKIMYLLEKLIMSIKESALSKEAFDVAKAITIRNLKIFAMNQQPYQQAMQLRRYFLMKPFYTPEERLESAMKIKFEDIKDLSKDVLKDVSIEALIQGNLKNEDAINCLNNITSNYNLQGTYKINDCCSIADLKSINDGLIRLRLREFTKNPDEKNNASILAIQFGVLEIEDSALLKLSRNYFSQPFFDTLRTKQQIGNYKKKTEFYVLGYIVSCNNSRSMNCEELQFLAQSNWLKPTLITERIGAFIEYYGNNIEEQLTQEMFENLREGLIIELEEKPKRLEEETRRNFNEVVLRRFDFNRREKQINYLKLCKRKDFINFILNKFIQNPWIATEISSKIDLEPAPQFSEEDNTVHLKPKESIEWLDIEDPSKFISEKINSRIKLPNS